MKNKSQVVFDEILNLVPTANFAEIKKSGFQKAVVYRAFKARKQLVDMAAISVFFAHNDRGGAVRV